jgi:hypothetical protein
VVAVVVVLVVVGTCALKIKKNIYISEKQYTLDKIWKINCRQKFIDVSEEYISAIFRVQKPRNQPGRCRKPSIARSSDYTVSLSNFAPPITLGAPSPNFGHANAGI